MHKCGDIGYIAEQLEIEKFDKDDNPHYVKIEALQFKILNIRKGRIGLRQEFSDNEVLVDVLFYSDVETKFKKTITIFMSQKRHNMNDSLIWQIERIPS
jgi:hypothetical protein